MSDHHQPPGGSGGGGFGQPPGGGQPPSGGGFGQPPGGQPPGGQPPGGGGFGQPPGGQPPGGGGFGQPPGGQPPGGGLPSPWEGQPEPPRGGPVREIPVSEVIDNFKALLPRASGAGLLAAYLVLQGIVFAVRLPGMIVTAFSGSGLLNTCLGIFATVVSVAVTAIMFGLLYPVRELLVSGPGSVGGAGAALRMARERAVPLLGATVVLVVAVFVLSFCCIVPGIAAFFFLAMAPYLVAIGRAELPDAFKRSFELAKMHWQPMAAAVGAMLVAGLILAGFQALVALGGAFLGSVGTLIAAIVGFLIFAAAYYPALLLLGATVVTIETTESGIPVQRG